eukprot:7376434-Prymnesium_polylepis.2
MPPSRKRKAEAAAAPAAAPTDGLEALVAAYANVDGYAVANTTKRQQRERGIFLDGLTYGEIEPAAFARALEWVDPRDGESFCDLGSGTGK